MDEKKVIKEKGKFSISELVLCYEPDPMKAKMLYDAKVLDIDVTKDEKGRKVCEYYIHFQGWNKSWDRWILEDRILKDNEVGRGIQSKLLKEAIKPKKRKRKITKSETQTDDKDDNKSVASTQEVEEEIKVIQLPPVSLDIPKMLANKLEDDCYNIKRRKKLIHLPRKPCVSDILSDYYNHCKSISTKPEGRNLSLPIIEELIEGLTVYFNFFLNTLLLYNFEREQYLKFFPVQQPPPYLVSLHNATPPVTPILSPKLASLIGLDKVPEPKQLSRQNSSRSSSISEDLPLAPPVKRPRGRPQRRKSNLPQVEKLEHETRRRSDSNSTNNTLSPLSPVETTFPKQSTSKDPDNKRETRSRSCKNKTPQQIPDIVIKKEPIDDDENVNKETKPSLLRRSSRLPRTTNSQTTAATEATEISIPTKKTEQELSTDFLKPLTVQTENLLKSQHQQPSSSSSNTSNLDHTFIMYPLRDDNKTPIDIYGPEHFLRLFVKLPVLLASSNIEQPKLSVILKNVSKLLEYLTTRMDLFNDAVYSESVI